MAGKDRNNKEHQKEYAGLEQQQKNTQKKINSCEDRIETLDDKIARLKKIKEEIADLKKNFRDDVYKEDKSERRAKVNTQGDEYTDLVNELQDMENADDAYYDNTLDGVHDSINNEITRLENKRSEEYGILGDLYSWFNSLGNKIENFFN